MSILQRKNDHISVNLEKDVLSEISNGFERWRLIHNALPEKDYQSFTCDCEFLGKRVTAPVMISSITGGTLDGTRINRVLLEAANQLNIPFAMGSQRIFLMGEDDGSFEPPRQIAPTIPILANIGAVQLNYGFTREKCLRAVESIGADALYLHLNPLQELLQKDGDTNFSGLLQKISDLCRDFPVPIIIKEVGWGISVHSAKKMVEAGVSMIDIAGAGGTSWSKVEAHVCNTAQAAALAAPFAAWGIPTADCVAAVHKALPQVPLIASGGISDGVEVCKAIHLGASMCGMARMAFLAAAENGCKGVIEYFENVIRQYKIASFVSEGIELIQ